MKKLLSFLFMSVSIIGTAQSIEEKISNDALAVVSINGAQFFELVSEDTWNNSAFFKNGIAPMVVTNKELTNPTLADLGADFNSNAFFFYQQNDSLSYGGYIIKMADKDKYFNIFSEENKAKVDKNEKYYSYDSSLFGNDYSVWNDEYLIVIGGEASRAYFEENEEVFMADSQEDESLYRVRKRIQKEWIKQKAIELLLTKPKESIATNKSYKSSKCKKAAASVWINSYSALVKGVINQSGSSKAKRNEQEAIVNSLTGFKTAVAHLYFKEDKIQLKSQVEVDGQWKEILKEVYSSKMDKKFFKYFDQDEALAYMSTSISTQAVFEQYPVLIKDLYGSVLPRYKEETDLGTDMFSLIVDEEALGELLTGDILLVLNNLEEKEVSYTSYEYDEEYNTKEVTKTKMEIVPDFTLMFGSEREDIWQKVVKLGEKYKMIEDANGTFKIDLERSKLPFDLYIAMNDDIIFVSTNEAKTKLVASGVSFQNAGKHKKIMRKNTMSVYVNGDQLLPKIPSSDFNSKEQDNLWFVQKNYKEVTIEYPRVKCNKFRANVEVKTTEENVNSLQLLLDSIDYFLKNK